MTDPNRLGRYPAVRLAPNALDRVNFTEITLQRLMFAANTMLAAGAYDTLKVSSRFDARLEAMIYELNTMVWARHVGKHSHRWPANWFEAVKERFAPKWFLKEFPVEYRGVTVDAYHSYPELTIKGETPVLQFVYHPFEEV